MRAEADMFERFLLLFRLLFRKAPLAWLGLLACLPARAATVEVDVAARYGGVSLGAIGRAISDARQRFSTGPDDTVILRLPAGEFALAPEGETDSIDVSRIQPGPGGRLILQGAGSGKTTLVFNTHRDEIFGRNTNHVAFVGLHFTIGRMTVSQGLVEQASADSVVLRIDDGFPTPADLTSAALARGRYLRRCPGSGEAPHIDDAADDVQVPWLSAEPVAGTRWRLHIRPGRGRAPFRVGDRLAIKSKNDNGNAYRFIGGSDVTFDDVAWTRVTRGVFRGGMSDVKILNSSILRDPPVHGRVPCLASAAGGPQIGQPRDAPTSGDIVRNFTAAGTGDDALAFFNASGSVSNVTIADSFARGILLYRSPGVTLSNVHVQQAPVLRIP
jgi:hypothetical protein